MAGFLDDILGKTALRERISELEDEKENLEERLEAENRRRSNAVTDKQEAQRELNKLESKIEELEDKLRREDSDNQGVGFRAIEKYGYRETGDILDFLGSMNADNEDLTSIYLSRDSEAPDIIDQSTRYLLDDLTTDTGKSIYIDDYGIINLALIPPREITNDRIIHGDKFDVDKALFQPNDMHAVAIIRSDVFSAGIYQDNELIESISVDSDVMGSHSKGGWSQSRFERKREEQIENHLDKSKKSLGELLDKAQPNYGLLGGEKKIAYKLHSEIDEKNQWTVRGTDTRGEKDELLENGFNDLWSTRIYHI